MREFADGARRQTREQLMTASRERDEALLKRAKLKASNTTLSKQERRAARLEIFRLEDRLQHLGEARQLLAK